LKSLHKKLKLLYTVNNIEELKIPLFVAVTNLNTGKIEYKNEGNLIDYVTASSSIPFLFKPVNINGISYVDGGLIDNLPIAPLKNICEKLIIVNLIPMTARTEFKRSVHLMKQVADVMVYHHNKSEIGANDILIEPGNISKYSYFSSKKAEEIFNVGYFYTKEFISG
jgi:NTE family protein